VIEFGNVIAVLAASFALGIFWTEFLRRPQQDRYRLTAISFVGVLIGEAIVSAGVAGGPAVYGLHPVAALISSFSSIYLQTAWVEKKAWPWDIIGELGTLRNSAKTMHVPSVTVPGIGKTKSGAATESSSTSADEKPAARKAA